MEPKIPKITVTHGKRGTARRWFGTHKELSEARLLELQGVFEQEFQSAIEIASEEFEGDLPTADFSLKFCTDAAKEGWKIGICPKDVREVVEEALNTAEEKVHELEDGLDVVVSYLDYQCPLDAYKGIKKIGLGPQFGSRHYLESFPRAQELAIASLSRLEIIPLVSKVANKDNFAIGRDGRISRAIRADLWEENAAEFKRFLFALEASDISHWTPEHITKAIYSHAAAVFAYVDLWKPSQKTPGTYFEFLIACLVFLAFKIKPTKAVKFRISGEERSLPTDLIFDPGTKKTKFHVPVKTSTRERIIQVWAHQRVIDGISGTGSVKGIPVVFAETKTNSKTKEVVEICLPLQWKLYQHYIATMTRIYYLDIPQPYAELEGIAIKPIGEFFTETAKL